MRQILIDDICLEIERDFDREAYIQGKPIPQTSGNDFRAIPAESDLRELIALDFVELNPAAWNSGSES